jgi:putative ABC transport system permease protein
MSIDSLRANKLRSSLTVLGVVIGITSVIALSALSQGAQKATERYLSSLGGNIMLVLAGPSRVGLLNQSQSTSTLTLEDARAIEKQAPAVGAISGFLRGTARLVYSDANYLAVTNGVEANYPLVRDWYPQEGRFFTEQENEKRARVIVLGFRIRDRLFGEGVPSVGKRIRVQGESYTVVGVMSVKGGIGTADPDEQVYLPLLTAASRLTGSNALQGLALSGLFVQVPDPNQVEAAQFQITNLLRLRHRILPGQEDDFSISTQQDVLQVLDLVSGLFTVMILSIASISLVVGGIGIANIMLVSVVERTREIGIRKALGATNGSILLQFLTEAIVISSIGGVIGILAGIGLATGIALVVNIPLILTSEPILVSFTLSVAVGLLAGVIPARSASRLDPITALRTD